jgi:hypothetical protein
MHGLKRAEAAGYPVPPLLDWLKPLFWKSITRTIGNAFTLDLTVLSAVIGRPVSGAPALPGRG